LEIRLNQTNNVIVILCLTIGIVIIINIGIIAAFRRGSDSRVKPFKTFGQALNLARNPWKKENEQLNELSHILDSIQDNSEKSESN
jgi:hypothetical protein